MLHGRTLFHFQPQLTLFFNKISNAKIKKAEEVGASAKRVARAEGPERATPRGQRAREACDAKIEKVKQ